MAELCHDAKKSCSPYYGGMSLSWFPADIDNPYADNWYILKPYFQQHVKCPLDNIAVYDAWSLKSNRNFLMRRVEVNNVLTPIVRTVIILLHYNVCIIIITHYVIK